jgi:hypothetical protein
MLKMSSLFLVDKNSQTANIKQIYKKFSSFVTSSFVMNAFLLIYIAMVSQSFQHLSIYGKAKDRCCEMFKQSSLFLVDNNSQTQLKQMYLQKSCFYHH